MSKVSRPSKPGADFRHPGIRAPLHEFGDAPCLKKRLDSAITDDAP